MDLVDLRDSDTSLKVTALLFSDKRGLQTIPWTTVNDSSRRIQAHIDAFGVCETLVDHPGVDVLLIVVFPIFHS